MVMRTILPSPTTCYTRLEGTYKEYCSLPQSCTGFLVQLVPFSASVKALTPKIFSILSLTYIGGLLFLRYIGHNLNPGLSCRGMFVCFGDIDSLLLEFDSLLIEMWRVLFPILGMTILIGTFTVDIRSNQLSLRERQILRTSAKVFLAVGMLSVFLVILLNTSQTTVDGGLIDGFRYSLPVFCIFVLIMVLHYAALVLYWRKKENRKQQSMKN